MEPSGPKAETLPLVHRGLTEAQNDELNQILYPLSENRTGILTGDGTKEANHLLIVAKSSIFGELSPSSANLRRSHVVAASGGFTVEVESRQSGGNSRDL
ncbi:hypothetical protein AVEN_191125-1 [Araneus ventricosus]|uniref:Uncharacterized protein n=1 Tax=Araneus ventricosus TaxID=182803 RepID=A0A4Y2AY27_ARAVE|nr:hypothetical protein AVEN_191125-1 [Araneus ventricosus]